MANERAAIVLQMLLDRDSQELASAGIGKIDKAIQGIQKTTASSNQRLFQEQGNLNRLRNEEAKSLAKSQAIMENLSGIENGLNELAEKRAQRREQRISEEERLLQIQQEITSEYHAQLSEISRVRQMSEKIGQAGRGLFLGGTAMLGGLFAAGQREANRQRDIGNLTQQSKDWLAANRQIENSMNRIGKVAQAVILPYLEKAANFAQRVSKFVEAHPESLEAIAKTGAVLAGLGAITIAVSKGIKFVADIKYIAANVQFDLATRRFEKSVASYLGGSVLKGSGVGGALGAGGSIAAIAGTVSAVLAVVLAGASIGTYIYNQIAKHTGMQSAGTTAGGLAYRAGKVIGSVTGTSESETERRAMNMAKIFRALVDHPIESLKDLASSVKNLGEVSDEAKDSIDEAAEAKGQEIIRNLERENLEAARKLAEERENIIRDANEDIARSNSELAAAIARIRQNLAKTLASLASSFASENAKAYSDFLEQQSQIVRDGEEDIRRIRENAQEQLRKLEEDYAEQRDELTRSRDALGLVKAERDFEKGKNEIERARDKEIAERRRDIAMRLADLRQSYERERAERLAKYQQDVAEANMQAAQEIAEERTANAQRIQEIQRQKALELNELQKAYNDERRQRIMSAYDQIQDLGTALNAERTMRVRYYDVILADARAFMDSFASALHPNSGGGGFPNRHSGGYAGSGLHNLLAGEYVMNPATVSAAETLLGGRITKQNLLSGLSKGTQNTVNINDSRRFGSRLTAEDRQWIRQENERYVAEMLNGIGSRRRS